ncbi:MAG: hypothetical protein WBM53_04415 [Maribacter sp.]
MKNSLNILILTCALIFTNCKKDDVATAVILQSVEYNIYDVAGSGITGKATFTQEDNGSTHVLIELDGATTATNPAFIRYNTAAKGGDVAITLKVCECSISNTTITKFDSGSTITYEGLLNLNGHITIHQNGSDQSTIVAVADIGVNGK